MKSELGVKLLDESLSYLVDGQKVTSDSLGISKLRQAKIRHNLNQFDIKLPLKPGATMSLQVPELQKVVKGSAYQFIEEAAQANYGPVRQAVQRFFLHDSKAHNVVEKMPTDFVIQPGWTRYDGDAISSVPHPLEGLMVIDVETLVQLGNYPVMAAALTDKAWYIWLHPSLMPNTLGEFKPEMIPVGQNKIIVNFSTKFDTARFEETYNLKNNNVVFDLRSAHIAVCGMSSKQRESFILMRSGKARYAERWFKHTSKNSLIECYNLHTKPRVPLQEAAKEIRNIFMVASGPNVIKASLNSLIHYNLLDVKYTFELGQYLLPKYFKANPHIATFAGHLILNKSKLPVSPKWHEWTAETDRVWAILSKDLEAELTNIAKDLVKSFMSGALTMETIQADIRLRQLDWTPAKSGKNKGAPLWWRKVKFRVTTRSKIAPYILGLSMKGKPLVYIAGKAWCYESSKGTTGAFEVKANKSPTGNHTYYIRVPHKKGGKQNCGNPLGKDYLAAFEDGVMAAANKRANNFMKRAVALTYWTAVRKRVFSQIAWPLKDGDQQLDWLMIEPDLAAHGTTSRRCVERLWLTLSSIYCKTSKEPQEGYEERLGENVQDWFRYTKPFHKVGAELKSRVQAPPGYVLVGADFDQQEMKIASGYSDAYEFQEYGATAMGATTIAGSKKDKTDNHSLLAQFLGIIRDIAKTMNFQMLYLCGVGALISAIKKERADWEEEYCKVIAKKAIALRRGTKERDSGLYRGGTDSHAYNMMVTLGNANRLPSHLNNLQPTGDLPRTPLCGSAMSEAILYKYCDNHYLTSRSNWGIQSSGADLLHCSIVVMEYLCQVFGVEAQFMFSIHDEAWFLAKVGHEKQCAALLQLTSVIAWSAFFGRIGMTSMPESYAWFSAVNIDTCLRKEVWMSQLTKSNKEDIEPGYELDPRQCVEILNDMISKLEG